MARILVVYKEFPAPSVGHAGGRAVFRLLESLHRRGHRLFLVARLRGEEAPLVKDMAPFCEHIVTVPHHQALPGPFPLAFLRSYLALRRAAARALREVQPDLLHVEVMQTAFCLLGLHRPPSSFRPLDVNWYLLEQQIPRLHGLRRWLTQALSRFFRRFEPWLCRRYDLIAAISEGDRRLLAPRCQPRPVLLLPLAPAFAAGTVVKPAVPPGPNVLFVGAMYRTFNVQGVRWFLEEVWPQVLARVPQARFYVVGHRPTPEIRAFHNGEQVCVTGFVEDLAPWYRAAAVFVSPLLVAGGLLQKILDALAMGVPVVATSVSNHGVGATPGEHLLVADDAAGFAAAVARLLEEPAERERLGRAGQQFVQERYGLERAVDRWEAEIADR
ncbi:MAG TPA: glycosyltransferase [Chloroflexi bacterium]|nr:glycosyltransferase [Chloroflexota bacterium]